MVKVLTFSTHGERKVGILSDDNQSVLPIDFPTDVAASGLLSLIKANENGLPETFAPIPLADVQIEAPIPLPHRNIFCVGKNYHEHAHEFANSGFDSSATAGAVPKSPIIFSKLPQTVIASGEDVIINNAVSTAIDYEAELAVIIGKGGQGITAENAFDHVWGYSIINDVTARDLQGKYSQWLIGKSQDTFCPMGPWAVSKDEIDVTNTGIRCFVNDELRQDSNTGLLIFDIPTIISTISEGITLMPGDIIATGTPAGVGIGFTPPKYLKGGDVVRVEIDGIGSLENKFQEIN